MKVEKKPAMLEHSAEARKRKTITKGFYKKVNDTFSTFSFNYDK